MSVYGILNESYEYLCEDIILEFDLKESLINIKEKIKTAFTRLLDRIKNFFQKNKKSKNIKMDQEIKKIESDVSHQIGQIDSIQSQEDANKFKELFNKFKDTFELYVNSNITIKETIDIEKLKSFISKQYETVDSVETQALEIYFDPRHLDKYKNSKSLDMVISGIPDGYNSIVIVVTTLDKEVGEWGNSACCVCFKSITKDGKELSESEIHQEIKSINPKIKIN